MLMKTGEIIETAFWAGICRGDEEAFRALYENHADWLFSYGFKIVPDADVVTEAIQSLFVYLFEKRETISEPKSVNAYLAVSLKRLLIGELRRTQDGSLQSLDDLSPGESQFALEIDVESAMVNAELEKEQVENLQKELNALTKQQREVLYLKYYKNLSTDEIAQIMGLTSRTVYNTAYMALQRLKGRMLPLLCWLTMTIPSGM